MTARLVEDCPRARPDGDHALPGLLDGERLLHPPREPSGTARCSRSTSRSTTTGSSLSRAAAVPRHEPGGRVWAPSSLTLVIAAPSAFGLAKLRVPGRPGSGLRPHRRPDDPGGGHGARVLLDLQPHRHPRHDPRAGPRRLHHRRAVRRDAASPPSCAASPASCSRPRSSTEPRHWRTFRSVVMPISRNSAITVALFSFLWAWSDFLFASTLDREGGRPTPDHDGHLQLHRRPEPGVGADDGDRRRGVDSHRAAAGPRPEVRRRRCHGRCRQGLTGHCPDHSRTRIDRAPARPEEDHHERVRGPHRPCRLARRGRDPRRADLGPGQPSGAQPAGCRRPGHGLRAARPRPRSPPTSRCSATRRC